jgi:hypothetical protein
MTDEPLDESETAEHANAEEPDAPLPPMQPSTYRWLALLVLLAAILIGSTTGVSAARTLTVRRWPTTQGTVRSARIVIDTMGSFLSRATAAAGRSRQLRVEYDYSVNGHSLRGARIRLPGTSRQRAGVDSLAYPVGATVVVHYDPREPSSAVLDTRFGWATIAGLGASIAMLLGAVWLLMRSVTSLRLTARASTLGGGR